MLFVSRCCCCRCCNLLVHSFCFVFSALRLHPGFPFFVFVFLRVQQCSTKPLVAVSFPLSLRTVVGRKTTKIYKKIKKEKIHQICLLENMGRLKITMVGMSYHIGDAISPLKKRDHACFSDRPMNCRRRSPPGCAPERQR